MRKVTYRVILEVSTIENDDADGMRRLQESGFIIDPDNDATDDVLDIQDIEVMQVDCEDSR